MAIEVFNIPVTPFIIPEIVQNAKVLKEQASSRNQAPTGELDVDVLKLDIDSYDCVLLRPLLRELSVGLLVLEINPWFPPPLKFARLYHPHPNMDALVGSDSNGCSLSYILELVQPSGFQLLHVSDEDVILAHHSVMQAGGWQAQDESECYRRVSARGHGAIPIAFLREWFFGLDPHHALIRAWGNITENDRQRDLQDHPFSLAT
eukprot:TRINITY_DN25027_c0_g1_i2.p1 TRINITY_DN25027_c0_g1~~TRINITY_DN25027_c0_g1_i2.p1  ORF type:complete len:205 (-),score=28.94 TRINITY_DN25027_c0_g1_i2:587-1201(-)